MHSTTMLQYKEPGNPLDDWLFMISWKVIRSKRNKKYIWAWSSCDVIEMFAGRILGDKIQSSF